MSDVRRCQAGRPFGELIEDHAVLCIVQEIVDHDHWPPFRVGLEEFVVT